MISSLSLWISVSGGNVMRCRKSQHLAGLLVAGSLMVGWAAVAPAAARRPAKMHPRGSSAARNIALTRYFLDQVFNKGHLWVADRLLSRRFVDHNPFPDQGPGVVGMKNAVAQFRSAFPDLHIVVQDIVAANGQVAIRSTFYGTQR